MTIAFFAVIFGLALLAGVPIGLWKAHRIHPGTDGVDQSLAVHSQVLRKEFPILTSSTALATWQIWDGEITRTNAPILLSMFGGLMAWTIRPGSKGKAYTLGTEMEQELEAHPMPLNRAVVWLIVGPIFLIASSRILWSEAPLKLLTALA